ncbi:MAG TPA: calcium/proton exchanger [Methylomusa anaerophila]|uniref:Ca(2+)/H(+) antiporter n=1 Tax=Methylomusa anaerophila TaxID=1930071 RepID=A0A348AFP9_9FIRM|nr:calcium/proton exchanger [Methylomusa anaerophila]BBB89897.1 putative cation exchanger YfkE [Methylomusa anaerophila]HML90557.1 calcium/proton exchanger [Methylomusa anaerophila]
MARFLPFTLILIPISFVSEIMHWDPVPVFMLACLAILPLAVYMGFATEELALYTNPQVGGFLNAAFGNATELIIAFFALQQGMFDVVKASIAGSILGNSLLVLGASMLAGGLCNNVQHFNKKAVELSSTLLTFAIIGLCIPAVFLYTVRPELLDSWEYEPLNLSIAAVMLIIYILGMYLSFRTNRDVYGTKGHGEILPKWSRMKAIAVLLGSTALIAWESEILVGAIEPMTKALGISPFFVGIILIPLIGNAAEHSTAVWMAMKNKMDIATEIAIGSSLQIALFVMPCLVIVGALINRTMSLVFNIFEIVSLIVSIVIVNRVAGDGESNWLEGLQLLAVYLIIAACFLTIR